MTPENNNYEKKHGAPSHEGNRHPSHQKEKEKETANQDVAFKTKKHEKFSPGEYAGYNAEDFNTD